jgi:hypothetical protein
MTGPYIDNHFSEIVEYAPVIESRLDDAACTIETVKADNQKCFEGFTQAGEEVVLMDGSRAFLQCLPET